MGCGGLRYGLLGTDGGMVLSWGPSDAGIHQLYMFEASPGMTRGRAEGNSMLGPRVLGGRASRGSLCMG